MNEALRFRVLARLAPAAIAIAALLFPTGATATGTPLTLEERVQAQRAIEEVHWRHRIWPKENPTRKPPLPAGLSDATIRAKVEDYLKKSNALEKWWQRPVTSRQLQAELDRIARSTRDPEMLRELYAALGNDAFLIAETLARPALVDRLIRNWYASDDRFHGEVERSAREAVAGVRAAGEMPAIGGEYTTAVYRLDDQADWAGDERVVSLDAEDWSDSGSQLAGWFAEADWGSIPIGRPSALQEDADRYFIVALLARTSDEMTVATVTWAKRPFDAWWGEESGRQGIDVRSDGSGFTVAAPRGTGCIEDTWQHRSYSVMPGRRSGHTAVWTGTEMIVWGDYNAGGFPHSGGRYDPATDSWTPTSTGANVPSLPRRRHTAVWTGTEMIVWGGDNTGVNTGGRYNPATDSWAPTSTGTNVPSARTDHTAVWTGTEMIVWGGTYSISGNRLSTGGRYSPATDSWAPTSIGTNVPSARADHTAVWTGTEMIVWGGYGYGGPLDNGMRYRPETDSWHPMFWPGGSLPERSNHTAVWTGTEMIVWGGDGRSGALDSGGRYDPAADSWTLTSTGANVPSARTRHTAVWTGTEMVVWGGCYFNGNSWFCSNAGGRYDPATDSWTPTPIGVNLPSGRTGHTAIWTGTEMIVWGGYYYDHGESVELDTGGHYDPTTESWTPTSTGTYVPIARSGHATVWTGTEMIVWGGYGDSRQLNTGERYDPAIDSWTPTSTGTNLPTARGNHTAVWTGTEMIVWGGRDVTGNSWSFLDTGGRYDPATDSWTPTSTGTNLPTARGNHTAVWTGTQMIMWGGSDGNSILNTGGRYDPATDSWTSTSTAPNVPSERSGYTSVWTGTEMVVWGGDYFVPPPPGCVDCYGSYASLDTGGRYDPATDSWTPTSIGTNLPTARLGHSAVWTGTEMIVWGGGYFVPPPPGCVDCYGSFASLDTGGRYDPASDSWTSTSTGTDLPTARSGHRAVWTGTVMIVSGGQDDFGTQNDLGLYCASGCQVPTAMWRDLDSDGFGDPSARADNWTCALPEGWRGNDDDCDDSSAGTHPGAVDIPGNALDEDCSGTATCDPSASWKNHGALVSCVARECDGLVENDLMTASACGAAVSAAARSSVGKR